MITNIQETTFAVIVKQTPKMEGMSLGGSNCDWKSEYKNLITNDATLQRQVWSSKQKKGQMERGNVQVM